PRDRRRQAAAMAGTPPGLPARRPRSRIPRTRRPGEHPPRCCGHFPRTSDLTRTSKSTVVTREHRRLRTEPMDRRLAVRYDVDRDDRRRLSQGNRLSALREGPPVGASSRRRLSAPAASPSIAGPCRPSDGGELPPVRAERHRVHTVDLASEDPGRRCAKIALLRLCVPLIIES